MADAEINLLTQWGDPDEGSRRRKAAVLSVLAHVAVATALLTLPAGLLERPEPVHTVDVTPLVEPPTQLTQKAPTTGKVTKEFEARASQPRPRVLNPAAIPAPVPRPPVPVTLPEPPKVETAVKEPPKPLLPQGQIPPPQVPQIQEVEKPKIVLENVGGPSQPVAPELRRVPIPDDSVRGAMRGAAGGSPSAGPMRIDPGALSTGGLSEGPKLPPYQLLSDPQGVDFQPYLMQILATVKRNWLTVVPEAVRLGRQGTVAIVFSISRAGAVPKLVISSSSGAEALDRAAVAGISMSNPFPPLPAEYKGDRIIVQFNFSYNMPRK